MKDNEIITYPLKVEKEHWKKFKGTSYLLGFDTVNDTECAVIVQLI